MNCQVIERHFISLLRFVQCLNCLLPFKVVGGEKQEHTGFVAAEADFDHRVSLLNTRRASDSV